MQSNRSNHLTIYHYFDSFESIVQYQTKKRLFTQKIMRISIITDNIDFYPTHREMSVLLT